MNLKLEAQRSLEAFVIRAGGVDWRDIFQMRRGSL